MTIPPDRKISTSIVGFWNFPSNLILRFKKIPFFRFFYLQNEMHLQLVERFHLSSPSFCDHDKLIFFLRCRFQCIRNINQFKTKSAVLRQTTCALSWERDQEKKNDKIDIHMPPVLHNQLQYHRKRSEIKSPNFGLFALRWLVPSFS